MQYVAGHNVRACDLPLLLLPSQMWWNIIQPLL